ncbi:hypothetical protein VTI74DRAFT_3953 [Chaetomium olivicolor]
MFSSMLQEQAEEQRRRRRTGCPRIPRSSAAIFMVLGGLDTAALPGTGALPDEDNVNVTCEPPGCGTPSGAMQNSLTGWHPANRIRGVCRRLYRRGAVMTARL